MLLDGPGFTREAPHETLISSEGTGRRRGFSRGPRGGRRFARHRRLVSSAHRVLMIHASTFNAIYEHDVPGVKPVRTTGRADLVAGTFVEVAVIAKIE